MQNFHNIPDSQTLADSRPLLLENDRTVMSCNSGTAFPTDNLEGDDFEQACANEFAYNMALFMVGITSLTGCVPVHIEKIEPSKE